MVGPESSGKTTLAKALAEYYQTVWVPEYARTYLEEFGPDYQQADLWRIAEGQLAVQAHLGKQANGILFVDTELLTIKIWSDYKYGACDSRIELALAKQHYDLYVLCKPDFTWQPDPLRENPDKGDYFFTLYSKWLRNKLANFVVAQGGISQRINTIDQVITSKKSI